MRDINVTPLIDVLLVLLIIFMVVTPQTGLDVRLAERGEATAAGPSAIVLEMDEEGELTLDRKRVSREELPAKLREILAGRDDRTLWFRGSEKRKYRDIVSVLDAAKGCGVKRVGIVPAR